MVSYLSYFAWDVLEHSGALPISDKNVCYPEKTIWLSAQRSAINFFVKIYKIWYLEVKDHYSEILMSDGDFLLFNLKDRTSPSQFQGLISNSTIKLYLCLHTWI